MHFHNSFLLLVFKIFKIFTLWRTKRGTFSVFKGYTEEKNILNIYEKILQNFVPYSTVRLSPIPLNRVNALPRSNFHEIYKIKQIHYISVTVEAFKGIQRVKQCYRCQGFGEASEVCNFTPKCVRCAGKHLSKDLSCKAPLYIQMC